jgi:TonB family protein
MLQEAQIPVREAMDAAQYRRRMLLTLVLLIAAVTAMLVKDRAFWFGNDEISASDDAADSVEASPAPVLKQVAQTALPVSAPVQKTKAAKIAKAVPQPVVASGPVFSAERKALQPLQVAVVTGGAQHTIPANTIPSNSAAVKVDLRSDAASTLNQPPATNAVQRTRLSADLAQPSPQYPALAERMKVQGSVLMQAFIGADGVIRELRVLSGPAILSSAAREAAMQWRFRPYLQNGKAVETSARITVNFVINVSDDKARDHQDASIDNTIRISPANPGL